MLSRPPLWITAVAALAVGLSACGGGSATTATTASSPTTTGPTSSHPTPSSQRPSTITKTMPSRARTVKELKAALLGLKDLPSGFVVAPSGDAGKNSGSVSSKNPKCAPMVKLTNPKSPPGSKASAKVSLSQGRGGIAITERIDAMGTPDAVEALQASLKSAVAACGQLTMTLPGLGTSTVMVAEASAPKFGDHPFSARMTVTSGRLKGLEFMQVTAGVKDAIVQILVILGRAQDVDIATKLAVDKAKEVLGGGKSGA